MVDVLHHLNLALAHEEERRLLLGAWKSSLVLVSLNAPDRIRTYDLVFRKDPRYPLRYGSNPKLSLSPCEHRRQLPFFDVLVVSYPIEHRVIVIDHQCSVALIQHLIAFTKYRCLCVVW